MRAQEGNCEAKPVRQNGERNREGKEKKEKQGKEVMKIRRGAEGSRVREGKQRKVALQDYRNQWTKERAEKEDVLEA